MIVAINYADSKYRRAQKLNTKCAYMFGADKVVEYTPNSISSEFIRVNSAIWNQKRGGGYWIWKPYIILDALLNVCDEDIIVYTDSGSAFVEPIHKLIDAMNTVDTDIMAFSIEHPEYAYTKRDAFIRMELDSPEYYESPQICATYILVRKSEHSIRIIKKYLEYALDDHINTDMPNRLGFDNFEGFIDNRHDQTAWSLLCKKEGIHPFRDPSQWGNNHSKFSEEVNKISQYPQVIESHRKYWYQFRFQLEYGAKWWYYPLRKAVRGWYKLLRFIGNEKGNI